MSRTRLSTIFNPGTLFAHNSRYAREADDLKGEFKGVLQKEVPNMLTGLINFDKETYGKYEDEYIALTDKSSTPLVDIARFLSKIKIDINAYLNKLKDPTTGKFSDSSRMFQSLKNLERYVKSIDQWVNDSAKLLSFNIKDIYNDKYKSPEELRIKKEEIELQKSKEKGWENYNKIPNLPISKIAPTLKNYIRKGGTVKLNSLVNRGSGSWYGFWHGHILTIGTGSDVYRFHVRSDAAKELHGGYDVTGAHYNTENTIKGILTNGGYKIDEGKDIDLSELKATSVTASVTTHLDKIANKLEQLGYLKMALAIDKSSDKLEGC